VSQFVDEGDEQNAVLNSQTKECDETNAGGDGHVSARQSMTAPIAASGTTENITRAPLKVPQAM